MISFITNQPTNRQNRPDYPSSQWIPPINRQTASKHVTWFSRFIGIIVTWLTISLSSQAIDPQLQSLSGSYLGLFSSIHQPTAVTAQFDFATNLDFNVQLAESISGVIQIQGGNGGGSLGLIGPNAAVTDLYIQYTNSAHQLNLMFGSFDLPFGQQTAYLTNNADSHNQLFLLNPILYSALAGPVGTLNTLGINAKKSFLFADITAVVSNGTGETAINEGNDFLGLIRLDKTITSGLNTSITAFNSNDLDDTAIASNTSTGSDLTGWMIDARYMLHPVHIASYVGQLTYDDRQSTTSDTVGFWMIEWGYDTDTWFSGVRLSAWLPSDHNRSGHGIASQIPKPGLASSAVADTEIIRLQLGVGYQLEESLTLKVEWVNDSYESSTDVNALIVALNGVF